MGNQHSEYSTLMETFFTKKILARMAKTLTPANCITVYQNPERMKQIFKGDSF